MNKPDDQGVTDDQEKAWRHDLAAEVRAMRARRDMTHEQLAERAVVDPGVIRRLERGGSVTTQKLARVLAALGTTVTLRA